MELMSSSMVPLQSWEPFLLMLGNISNPFLAFLACIVFTFLIQSSTASVGVIQALTTQKLISISTAIAAVLGANVGAALICLPLSIGSTRLGIRVVITNAVARIFTAFLLLFLLSPFSMLAYLCSSSTDPEKIVAIAHTLFNIISMLIFMPITKRLDTWSKQMFPEYSLKKFDLIDT
jgi:phosphate:Na+ symporter